MSNIVVFIPRLPTQPARVSQTRRALADAYRSSKGATILPIWWARHQLRDMLRNELLLQPDSVLEDAGFTREQAEKEAAKPFWVS